MNDIKDIRQNPEKYRTAMRNRGKDPAEIDELLRVDEGVRLAKSVVQNGQAQSNIDTELWQLYNIPRKNPLSEEQKEKIAAPLRKKLEALQAEVLPIKQRLTEWQIRDLELEIEHCDREIAKAEAKIADCDRKEIELLQPHAAVLEEIVEEIKREQATAYIAIGNAHKSINPS